MGLGKKIERTAETPNETITKVIKPMEIRHKPEYDAKIDGFLKNRPDLVARIEMTPKEFFVRNWTLDLIQREEEQIKYATSIKSALERPENAALKKELEYGVRNVQDQDAKESLIIRDARALVRQGKLTIKSESLGIKQSIS